MRIDLAGKNALITGGARGIGRECARVLSEAGARVAVVDIDLEGAQDTVRTLSQGLALRCDLSDPEEISTMRQKIISEMGGVDILVNCAGIIQYRRGIGAVSLDEWDIVLDVNLRGTFLVCQEFIDSMKERRGGRIINFSSMAARLGGIEVGLHYTASKSGLIGLTRTLAKEAGPFGITVNAVAPGYIATGPVKNQIAGREDQVSASIPLRRIGEPRDVANVVLFLASPLSAYVTGVVLDINGGMFIG